MIVKVISEAAERRVAKNDKSPSRARRSATESQVRRCRDAHATRAVQQRHRTQHSGVEAATLAIEHVQSLTPQVTRTERGSTVMAMARDDTDRETDVTEGLEGAP